MRNCWALLTYFFVPNHSTRRGLTQPVGKSNERRPVDAEDGCLSLAVLRHSIAVFFCKGRAGAREPRRLRGEGTTVAESADALLAATPRTETFAQARRCIENMLWNMGFEKGQARFAA